MSSDALFDAVIKLADKDLTVQLKDGPDGLFVKLSEKSPASRRIILSIPLAGLEEFKKALNDAQKASKGVKSTGKAAPAAAASTKPARQPRETREAREPRAAAVNHSEPEVVSRSIYVSGLSWETNEDMLRTHYKRMGNIVKVTVLVRRRGRELVSRGCAVIEFKNAAEAQRAAREMPETELDGRTVKCREDRGDIAKDGGVAGATNGEAAAAEKGRKPRKERAERKPRKEIANDEGRKLEPTMVFVSNLSWDTTSDVLSNFMSAFGDVKSCEVLTAKTGRSLGHAVVAFARANQAKEAIERVNGKELDGRTVAAKEYYSFVDAK